ncbi:MAG: hypothetical protein ABEJ65_03015 [bacterium]
MKRLTLFLLSLVILAGMTLTPVTPLQAEGASISGVVEMDYTHIGTRDGKSNSDDNLTVQDVMFYVKGPVGDKAKFFSEFMINPNSSGDEIGSSHDQSIQVERMYLTTDKLLKDHTVKAGIFQLFDGTIKNYHVATGNPLPGDVVFFKNPWLGHHGNGNLHDVFTDVGLSVSGMRGPISYQVSGFNGQGEKTPSSTDFDDASPSGVFGKVQYTFRSLRGLQAGVSYYNASTTDDTSAYGGNEDKYVIGEIIYRRPAYKFTGLYLDGTQTRQGNDIEGGGFMVEGVHNTTSKLSIVGRYQTITPDDETENFFGAGTKSEHGTEYRGELEQIEVGVNYSWSPRLTLKASWQGNDEGGTSTGKTDSAADRVLGQVTASF